MSALPAEWPAGGAFSLPSGEVAPDEWLDQVLAALRRSGRRVAWLPAEGGLVSNLSLIENGLLPLQWQERLSDDAVADRFAQALRDLGLPEQEAGRFRQRPAQASPGDRRLTLYLRVLMQRPEVLVIAAGGLRGSHRGEAVDAMWKRCLSGSLLLYLGGEGSWPALPTGQGEQGP